MSRDTGIERRQRRGATVFCAVVYDKTTGRKTSKTFDTITAARQWRTDAMSALRAGTMTADRGPTLREAASQWLQDARDGHVRNRSGDPYKPSAIRGYEKNLRLRVLPALGVSATSNPATSSTSSTSCSATACPPARSTRRSLR